jgi:hypothetical protein
MTGQGHPAVPHPNQNYPGMSHDQLKMLVTQNVDPGTAYKAGDEWYGLSDQLRDAAVTLDAAINGSQSHWEGAAADLARAHLAKVRDWSADTAQYFTSTGRAMHDQVDAAAKAKADMPDPIEYNPGKMLAQAATNPISLIALPAEMYLTHEASNDAKAKAVQVIQARDTAMQSASSSIPAFTPPPDLGGGSTANTQLSSAGPVGSGGGVAAYHGTSGGGGGYSGSGYNPATGGGSYHAVPTGGPVPGGYNPNQVGGPGSGSTQLAGFDPGPGSSSYNSPNYGNTPGPGGPNSPYGPGGGPAIGGFAGGGGGAGGGSGSGSGYRSGSGAPGSTSSSSAKPGMGSSTGAGAAGEGGAGARGGMGAPGGAGNAGGAGRGGKKEEDTEHKRPTFLVETDDVFGDGQMVAPTVIGENPSGGY